MKLTTLIFVIILIFLNGCMGIGPHSKADKISKKEFKYLNENQLYFQATHTGTMSFTIIELRDQNYFQIYGHTALAGWQHFHGKFYRMNNSDTLVLNYANEHATHWKFALIRENDVLLRISLEDSNLIRPLILQTRLNNLSKSKSSFRWLKDSSLANELDSLIDERKVDN